MQRSWPPTSSVSVGSSAQTRIALWRGSSFFAYLATLTSFVVFPAWSDLLEALATFTIPPNLLSVQKNE